MDRNKQSLIEKRDELMSYLDFLALKHDTTITESKYYSVTGPFSDIYYSKLIDLIEEEFKSTRNHRDEICQKLFDCYGVK